MLESASRGGGGLPGPRGCLPGLGGVLGPGWGGLPGPGGVVVSQHALRETPPL